MRHLLKHVSAALAALALLATIPALAAAHAPNPAACKIAWQAAPPGQKHAALRRCQRAQAAHRLAHACQRPVKLLPANVTVKHRRARLDQRRNLTIALNLARRMDAPRNHRVALVAAMTQESSATNLPHGHGTSVGVLQLIDTHGSFAWRMKVVNSAGWFLRGARSIDPRGNRSPGRLAQDVQRSGYPYAYEQWVPEARRTVRIYLRPACVR